MRLLVSGVVFSITANIKNTKTTMTQHKKILKLKDLELAYQAAQHYDVIPNLGKAPELINDYGLKCNLDKMEDVLFLYRGETSADILNRIIELIREL